MSFRFSVGSGLFPRGRSGSCEDTSCFCGLSIHIPAQATAPHFPRRVPFPLHTQSWALDPAPELSRVSLKSQSYPASLQHIPHFAGVLSVSLQLLKPNGATFSPISLKGYGLAVICLHPPSPRATCPRSVPCLVPLEADSTRSVPCLWLRVGFSQRKPSA